jgi:hypothetical protein
MKLIDGEVRGDRHLPQNVADRVQIVCKCCDKNHGVFEKFVKDTVIPSRRFQDWLSKQQHSKIVSFQFPLTSFAGLLPDGSRVGLVEAKITMQVSGGVVDLNFDRYQLSGDSIDGPQNILRGTGQLHGEKIDMVISPDGNTIVVDLGHLLDDMPESLKGPIVLRRKATAS